MESHHEYQALRRWLQLLQILRRGEYLNKESLALELGCNARTVQRDIRALREHFAAPIEFDREQNGFYLRDNWRLDA